MATIKAEVGKITGLLGRNGAGKSTLLKILYGIEYAGESIISMNGKSFKKPVYAMKGMAAYLPQKSFVPKSFRIGKVLRHFQIDPEQIFSVFPELYIDFDTPVGELSGGQERLWSTLVILYSHARFIFLDEPFSHIMPLYVERIASEMVRLKQQKGIIITDHLYKNVMDISDMLYFMKAGQSSLIHNAYDLVIQGYLNEYQE